MSSIIYKSDTKIALHLVIFLRDAMVFFTTNPRIFWLPTGQPVYICENLINPRAF